MWACPGSILQPLALEQKPTRKLTAAMKLDTFDRVIGRTPKTRAATEQGPDARGAAQTRITSKVP